MKPATFRRRRQESHGANFLYGAQVCEEHRVGCLRNTVGSEQGERQGAARAEGRPYFRSRRLKSTAAA